MSEQMRKEFENWAVATKDQFGLPFFVMKDEQGKYIDHAAEISWQAWQASRAGIVVELPDWSEYDTPRQAIDACGQSLTEAGFGVSHK
jgi:hypothetical protein